MNYVLPTRFKNVKTYYRVQTNLQLQFQHTKLRLLKKKNFSVILFYLYFFERENFEISVCGTFKKKKKKNRNSLWTWLKRNIFLIFGNNFLWKKETLITNYPKLSNINLILIFSNFPIKYFNINWVFCE